jgi:hypothetical protein
MTFETTTERWPAMLKVILLNAILLNAILLNAILLNAILLDVVSHKNVLVSWRTKGNWLTLQSQLAINAT